MNTLKVISELKNNFSISSVEAEILNMLNEEQLTAKGIANALELPVERIYSYLASLESKGFVMKTRKQPKSYYIKDFKEAVKKYLSNSFEQIIGRQSEIESHIAAEENEIVLERITNREDFVYQVRRILAESETIDVIMADRVIPCFLYTEDKAKRDIMRNTETGLRKTLMSSQEMFNIYYESYWKAFSQNKRFRVLMSEYSFYYYIELMKKSFGKKEK